MASHRQSVAVMLVAGALAIVAACGSSPSRATGRSAATTTRPANRPTASATTTTTATTSTTTTTVTTPATTTTTRPPLPHGGPHRGLPTASVSMTFVDPSRPTVAYGRTIATSRTLPTTVWYPVGLAGPLPLVLFSHGYRIGPEPYARFCQQLASAGYVVAAPAFPLTDQKIAGANLDENDIVNQPGDVSFVITRLLAVTADPAHPGPLTGLIDPARIAATGHSDGASDSLATGYEPSLGDTRVRAIVAIAPDPLQGRAVVPGTIPLLDVHADADTIVPFANGQKAVAQIQTRRFFLVLHGADHLPPVQGGTRWTPVLDETTAAFLDRYLAERTTDDSAILAAGTQPPLSSITLITP